MSVETAVIQATGIMFFGMAYLGFRFGESESDLYKYLGVMFVALSIAILQVTGWLAVEMSLNAASLSYLGTGLVEPVWWTVNIALFLFWMVLLLKSLVYMALAVIKSLENFMGRGRGD